jgi:hypothetical protein
VRKRRYVFEEPADALVARARSIETGDDTAETRKAQVKKGFGITCGSSAILFVLAMFAGALWGDSASVLFVVSVLLALLSVVVGGASYAWYAGKDLDDRKVTTLTRFLGVVRADVPSAAPVRAEVDFRDYRKGVRVKKESGGWFSGLMTYGYEHTWLTLDTTLADGTRVRVSVTDHVKRKEKRKRKYTKVRERAVASVTLVLRLGKAYDDAQAVATRLRSLADPPSLHVEEVRGQARVLHVTVRGRSASRLTGRMGTSGELAPSDGDTLLQALRWVYRGLAPAAA